MTRQWYSSNASDSTRKHRLGVIHRGTMRQNNVLCRVITFERMTSYILEDFFKDLSQLKKMKVKNFIVPILGYAQKENSIVLFSNEYISLYELLYSSEREELRKNILDVKGKYNICL
jgi:endonuclease III-like uncharacterized protein